jgi:hypothetical protein
VDKEHFPEMQNLTRGHNQNFGIASTGHNVFTKRANTRGKNDVVETDVWKALEHIRTTAKAAILRLAPSTVAILHNRLSQAFRAPNQ